MATQSEIIEAVRSALDEASESMWSERELRRWINEGLRDIARKSEGMRATTDVALVADQAVYATPTDLTRIHIVEWLDSGGDPRGHLQYVDPHNFERYRTVTGTPCFWTSRGSTPALTVELLPTPTETGTLRIRYYRLPAELAIDTAADADTEIDLIAGWEDLIVHYVEYKALRKDRDPRWQEPRSLYLEDLAALTQQTTRYTDQAGQWGAGDLSAFGSYNGDYDHF